MSPKDDERVELRVPAGDLKRWRATAGVHGVQLSEWIRQTCNDAAVDQDVIDAVTKKLAEREAKRQQLRAARDRSPPLVVMVPNEPQPTGLEARRKNEQRKQESAQKFRAEMSKHDRDSDDTNDTGAPTKGSKR